MSYLLKVLHILIFVSQVYSYKTCYVYHNTGHDHNSMTTIRCSSAEYCCERGCCRKVYSIWYFWTMLLFAIFIGLVFCWWYRAHRNRQHIRVVQRTTIPMQVVQPYQHPGAVNYPNQPVAQYPGYLAAPPPYAVAVSAPPPPYVYGNTLPGATVMQSGPSVY